MFRRRPEGNGHGAVPASPEGFAPFQGKGRSATVPMAETPGAEAVNRCLCRIPLQGYPAQSA